VIRKEDIRSAVWDSLEVTPPAGSYGERFITNIDAPISSRSSHSDPLFGYTSHNVAIPSWTTDGATILNITGKGILLGGYCSNSISPTAAWIYSITPDGITEVVSPYKHQMYARGVHVAGAENQFAEIMPFIPFKTSLVVKGGWVGSGTSVAILHYVLFSSASKLTRKTYEKSFDEKHKLVCFDDVDEMGKIVHHVEELRVISPPPVLPPQPYSFERRLLEKIAEKLGVTL